MKYLKVVLLLNDLKMLLYNQVSCQKCVPGDERQHEEADVWASLGLSEREDAGQGAQPGVPHIEALQARAQGQKGERALQSDSRFHG